MQKYKIYQRYWGMQKHIIAIKGCINMPLIWLIAVVAHMHSIDKTADTRCHGLANDFKFFSVAEIMHAIAWKLIGSSSCHSLDQE